MFRLLLPEVSRVLPTVILAVLPLLGIVGPMPGTTDWWRPKPGIAWDIQVAIDPAVDLALPDEPIAAFDLDGGETTAATVADLHARDIRAICYVNVGAWESWRPDADNYPAAIIGADYPGWPGERFVDIRALDLPGTILEARFDDCAAKGFDAIEPDNIDTAFTNTDFPLTEADQLAFNRWLAGRAHSRGLAIIQKNVPELTPGLVEMYDGAISEDCAADGWCSDLTPYLDGGKSVLAIEYTDVTSIEAFVEICEDRHLAGLSLILKKRDLDATRRACT